DLDEALALLGAVRAPETALPPLLADFAAYLDTARVSAFVRWALLEPVEIHVRALGWRLDGLPRAELGRRLAESLDDWSTRLPLTDAWLRLSTTGLVRELEFLKRVLVRTPRARATL